MQSSLSSIQASGIWGQYQHSHHTLEHLPPVKKDVVSSQSAPGIIGAFLSPVVPVEHSTPTQKVAESFLSGQGYPENFKPDQGSLKLSISAQSMIKESQYAKGALQSSASSSELPEPYTVSLPTQGPAGDSLSAAGHLGLTVSPSQVAPFSHSDEGYVDPYFSGQGTLKLSKSAQGTLGTFPYMHGTEGHFIVETFLYA